jgi:uncharacterized protein (DUF2062 family)
MGDVRGWIINRLPRRDTIHSYPLLRPFARQLSRPGLWRMNRRSVPRAVALGLGLGIIMPFMHIALAALLAIPTRANIVLASAFTLVVNPLTMPPLYFAAYRLGSWELHSGALAAGPAAAQQAGGELAHMLFWIHQASGSIAAGIVTLAGSAALTGYAVSSLVWRLWVGGKWRRRRRSRQGLA